MAGQSAVVGSASRVVTDIGRRIDSGVWPDGFQLPPERTLALDYGLARNTVRRALQALEEDGRLVRHVGRGTFVKAEPQAAGTQILSRMREASPAEIMEVRLLIEPPVAAVVASRANAEDIAQIETMLRHSISAKGLAEFEHWDAQLHLAIFRAAKNALLMDYYDAINAVRSQPRWHRLKQRAVTADLRLVYDRQHTTIVAALRDRDPESARKAQQQHLVTVRDHLLGMMD
jgi:DNA-binding FadR family transcriptional regulator